MIWFFAMLLGFAAIFVSGIVGLCPVKLSECRIQLLMENTAALYEYIIYTVLTNIGLVCLSSMARLSNHAILTLEIIYNWSSMILILFHRFKEPENSLRAC